MGKTDALIVLRMSSGAQVFFNDRELASQLVMALSASAGEVRSAATRAATAAPVQKFEYVAPASVSEYIAPVPTVTYVVPSQQLPPVYNTTTDTFDDNLDMTGMVYTQFSNTAADPFKPHVVDSFPPLEKYTEPVYSPVHQEQIVAGEMTQNIIENSDVQAQVVVSLPPLEEFTKPVFNQIHQEQIAAGETTMNTAEIPVVKEQVIVQEIPEVDAPFPSVEEFTEPVYNPVHQEQIVAGEMTHNIIENSDVQEQVIVQEIPEVVAPPPPVEEFTEPVYNPVHQEQIVAGAVTQTIIENSVVQEQVIVQEIPEVVDSAADKAVSLDELRRILRDVNADLCANRLWHPGEHS